MAVFSPEGCIGLLPPCSGTCQRKCARGKRANIPSNVTKQLTMQCECEGIILWKGKVSHILC